MKTRHKSGIDLSLKELKKILSCNYKGGFFVWKKRPDFPSFSTRRAGKRAGSIDYAGYDFIRIGARLYPAHRLMWFFYYEEWPPKDIDHIDGNPSNNKISNLRLATPSENVRNRSKQKNNKSGYKGVHFNKQANKWNAKICVHKKTYHLGFFHNPKEASKAYNAAASKLHKDFACQ